MSTAGDAVSWVRVKSSSETANARAIEKKLDPNLKREIKSGTNNFF